MNDSAQIPQTAADRNKVAALLSVIPGCGHLYKRHTGLGLAILVPGNIFMLFVMLWLFMPTFGTAVVLVPAAWIAGIGAHAYFLRDRHLHAPAPPPADKMREEAGSPAPPNR